jgi:hypothetical protein
VQGNPQKDLSRDRQIRVFVSSTFRDMKEERDHLVKFIFPQLRKLCESRGVVWGEVDLRWGVTDEQKAEGKVLPICLEEIKRCWPYFIGLLGERYGWIPDAIPPEIVEREPWLAEHVHGRKSVTELEILHGVLNNPDMAEHAFFYFRDPAYVQSLPPDRKKDFATESTEDTERLRNLKERIRASRFPVRENYADPKALGDLVLADLTAVIDELYPEGPQLDPLDREAMDHEAYAQRRARFYIDRQAHFDRLESHARANGPPLVVQGEAGSGKSALLANWALRWRTAHPEDIVLMHFVGASPQSIVCDAMLRRITHELRSHVDAPQQGEPSAEPGAEVEARRRLTCALNEILYGLGSEQSRHEFEESLRQAAAKGHVVVVIDGLDEMEDRGGAQDLVWLPPEPPCGTRIILSTTSGRPRVVARTRSWPTLTVGQLQPPERQRARIRGHTYTFHSLNTG